MQQITAKEQVIQILERRMNEAFCNGGHNHEKKRMVEAIASIEELMPPDMFSDIRSVSETKEPDGYVLGTHFWKSKDDIIHREERNNAKPVYFSPVPVSEVGQMEEIKDFIETTLSAISKLGASDETIKQLLGIKYKIESLLPVPNTKTPEGSDLDWRQKLFNYMSKEHGVDLLESDMNEIQHICYPPDYPYVVRSNEPEREGKEEDKTYNIAEEIHRLYKEMPECNLKKHLQKWFELDQSTVSSPPLKALSEITDEDADDFQRIFNLPCFDTEKKRKEWIIFKAQNKGGLNSEELNWLSQRYLITATNEKI